MLKTYALILACLGLALSTEIQGQTSGGAAGGGGTGATGGAVGSGAGGQAGSAIGGTASGALTPGRSTPPIGTAPGLQRPLPGVRQGQGGVGTPGNPGVGTGAGVGTGIGTGAQNGIGTGAGVGQDTGAIGGIRPGVGGIGGTATGPGTPPLGQPNTGTTGDLQTGVTGIRGATPGVAGPGTLPSTGLGTANDLALTQAIRAQLLNSGVGAAPTTPGTSTALSRARGAGMITPQTLSNVQISAANGAVTLSGSVANEADRRLLENRVRQMTGVQTVVNNLTVGAADRRIHQDAAGTGTTTDRGVGAGSSRVGTGNGIGTVPSSGESPR